MEPFRGVDISLIAVGVTIYSEEANRTLGRQIRAPDTATCTFTLLSDRNSPGQVCCGAPCGVSRQTCPVHPMDGTRHFSLFAGIWLRLQSGDGPDR